MNPATQKVFKHLDLFSPDSNTYISREESEGHAQVFGGQIIAQCIRASQTSQQDGKALTSLGLTFVARADLTTPLQYEVSTVHSGKQLTRQRVDVKQGDDLRATAILTYQSAGRGFNHQAIAPTAPVPDQCANLAEMAKLYRHYYPGDLPDIDIEIPPQAVETRFAVPEKQLDPQATPGSQLMWVKFSSTVPDDLELHKAILGFMSDQSITHIVLQGQSIGAFNPRLRLLSLDHNLTFHRPFCVDEWMLLERTCPSLSQGLALVTGSFYTEDGALIATMNQNALVKIQTE